MIKEEVKRKVISMRVIRFKNYKNIPVCARVVLAVAFVLAIAGITTIVLSWFDIVQIKTCVSMALCVGSLLINNIVLYKYKDELYK